MANFYFFITNNLVQLSYSTCYDIIRDSLRKMLDTSSGREKTVPSSLFISPVSAKALTGNRLNTIVKTRKMLGSFLNLLTSLTSVNPKRRLRSGYKMSV